MIRQQDLPADKKPLWDGALSGLHPALRDLTVSEEELKQAMASAPSGLASADEKMRAHALASAESYAANLKFFMSPQYNEKDKAKKVHFYRIALSAALGDAGRFEESAAVLMHNGRALPNCKDALTVVRRAQEAVEKPDGEECDCPRETVEVEVDPDKPERGTHQIILNRRHSLGQIWSEKHGKMVHHWRWNCCGFENAHDQIPERQIKIHRHRAEIEQNIRAAARTGRPLTAKDWKPDPAFSDVNLLKDEQNQ